MLSKSSSTSVRIAWRSGSSKSGYSDATGTTLSRSRRFSHWPAKLAVERLGPRMLQHAPHLLFEHDRIVQAACRSRGKQLVVWRTLLHRKNDSRDARSMSLMR